jgi:CDP-diacylglycerol--glycerol-3-phosphate 3-phosphatidyltransferase
MVKNKKDIITFPNILSILRILLSPLIFFINENKFILFFLLLFIGLTDVLDGYIARKYNEQTIIGAWLDSIGDFVFYILLVIYAMVFEYSVIIMLQYYVIIIIALKLLTVIIGFVKYRKFGFLHTIGNKISGGIIFIGFCVFVLLRNTIVIKIGIIISIISSLEELVITIVGKKYEPNIKGIWEIKKVE